MAEKLIEGEKRAFMTGNEVVAWAALAAQADIMYGYPITPQNEVMHYWTRLSPKIGKKFLQTEDELSAGFTAVGGVMAGARAFTATGGPGTTLMQEPMSMAEAMRIPTVVIVQQRGGPSTGTVIYSQQELNLVTFGGNGEGHRIVYSTSTHQELFDYTIKAFNTAWKYRFPTWVLGDGYQAKMRESLMIYDPEYRGITMVPTEKLLGGPGRPGVDRPVAHWRNTYNVEEELYEVIKKYQADFERITPEVQEYEQGDCEDADLVILAHGIVIRSVKMAARELRSEGLKVGYFRPITLRPFPTEPLKTALAKAKKVLVVESAEGQFMRMVQSNIYGLTVPVEGLLMPAMGVTTEKVVERAKTMLQ